MGRRVSSLQRVGSGVAMMLAPLLWFASSALGPGHEASQSLAGVLPHIATDPDRFLASVLFGLMSLVLLIPAVLGVANLLHRRIPLLAVAGAALVLVGIVSLAVLHGVQLVQHQMIEATADRQQMVALLQRLEGGIGAKVIFAGLFLGLFLGWVTLSAGLLVTRSVPRAIPLSVLASLVLNFTGLERISRLLFLIGLAWLGALVLVTQDDRWMSAEGHGGPAEHLTYKGFCAEIGEEPAPQAYAW